MSTSNRSSAGAVTGKAAATSGHSAPSPAKSPTPERRRFVLSGPSRPLDHATQAARRDLADIAVAGQWFAPHYAVPETWTCTTATELHDGPSDLSRNLGPLNAGDRFSALEVSGAWAWGYRENDRCVGYVRANALTLADVVT